MWIAMVTDLACRFRNRVDRTECSLSTFIFFHGFWFFKPMNALSKMTKKKVNEQTNGETRRNRAGEKPQNLISSQAASNSWPCLNSNCKNPLKHQTPKRPPPQAPQEQISAHWGRGCRNHDNILPQQSRSTEVKWVCPTHLSHSNEHLPLLCSTQAGNTMLQTPVKVPSPQLFLLQLRLQKKPLTTVLNGETEILIVKKYRCLL